MVTTFSSSPVCSVTMINEQLAYLKSFVKWLQFLISAECEFLREEMNRVIG
jgi:hypothetical protein